MASLEEGDGPRTILFASMPFEYLADRARDWAGNGVSGVMFSGIMHNWDSDVWLEEKGRVVGPSNAKFQRLLRMNEICREAGVDSNFVKVAFYKRLPDWFDDEGWDGLLENFRQGAIFARDAKFRGIALDIEYISEIYDLTWEGYGSPGYPLEDLGQKARERGEQIVGAMLGEFPSMEFLHLPQSPECYGPLAAEIFAGMCTGMARRQSPGGLHLLTEATYERTSAAWLLPYYRGLDDLVAGIIPGEYVPYWKENCSISYGLWPLGYYRDIVDSEGNFLGYGGKRETFGDEVVGSYEDKSENYGVEEFREQFAASLMLCKRYIWIYCHGSTLWRLSQTEMERYKGSKSDSLPVVENLDEYLAVMKDRKTLADPEERNLASRVRAGEEVDFLGRSGNPREWNLIGPFDNRKGSGFEVVYGPEKQVDLGAEHSSDGGKMCWRRTTVPATGYVSLSRIYRPPDYKLAYALCYVDVPANTRARILLGSDDGAKVWVNGKLVFEIDTVRGATADQNDIPVTLPAGRSTILLKVANYRGEWGFYFRLVGENGEPIPGARFSIS